MRRSTLASDADDVTFERRNSEVRECSGMFPEARLAKSQAMRRGLGLVTLSVLAFLGASSAIAMRMSAVPQAFLRPRRPTDALPRGFRIPVGGYRVADSRRIASFSDRRGRP